MIRQTCRHYNTDKVIAVCHSKGGYDMEYALYNSNVWDSVQGVITLSTPYWGAPMSDMIATPIIRSFLEAVPIVGPIFKGKGSYQMQTAYMAGIVRPMMDNHPNNRPEKFHCFASWGMDHKTVLPSAIPDDILKVVFNDYRPLCLDIPGFGTFAGDLMSGGMSIIGSLSHLVQVQDKYNNPQKNQAFMDGLAPYYSSIRPGSVVISQPPPSQQSYLNHIDVLLASNMWTVVQPEIEYFKNNPVLRKKNSENNTNEVASYAPVSDFSLIQSESLEINTTSPNKLFLAGEYHNQEIKVLDENDQLVKTIPLNFNTQTMFDIFHDVDLSVLPLNKKYTLQSSTTLVGFLQDGNKASLQLNTHSDQAYFADEPMNLEVTLNDWSDDVQTTVIKGFLNRNIDENGNVIWDKMIPVSFVYNDVKQSFVSTDKIDLPDGIYNLSVYADGSRLKRFATTSLLIQQQRKKNNLETNQLAVYPNPASNELTIQFQAIENVNYSIRIYDIVGKMIVENSLSKLNPGTQHAKIFAGNEQFPKGSYLISLIGNGEIKGSKVVLIK